MMTEPKFSLKAVLMYLELEYSISIDTTQAAIILGTLIGIQKGLESK